MVDPCLPVYALVGSFHGSTCVKFSLIFRAHMFNFCYYTTARQIARIAFAGALDYDVSSANDVISILTSSVKRTVSTSLAV